MTEKTLYMAWQDKAASRRWFPVGRLDADVERPRYLFRYIRGAREAHKEVGFVPLLEFPNMFERYESPALIPIFQNRVLKPGRPDFGEYLRILDLEQSADQVMILAANGGTRMTDDYEVFPKIIKDDSGNFTCRFFLHGARHVSSAAQENNPGSGVARRSDRGAGAEQSCNGPGCADTDDGLSRNRMGAALPG